MATIRNLNEIVASLIDYYRQARPDASTNPGSAIRDLLIDAPANQFSLLYDELSLISDQQSFIYVGGKDLDKLAKNFGITRKAPSPSSGIAILTFSSLPANVAISAGSIIYSSTGYTYKVLNGVSVSTTLSNYYKSIASKYRNDLDFVGISDIYAVEVNVQCTASGSFSNLPKYNLSKTNIPGVSNVTNAVAFINGKDQESDSAFRNRVLSIFNGSSIGTNIGYKNAALSTDGVVDAYVVEPGDALMERDGSVIATDATGIKTVQTEGSGGKVDVVVLGTDLVQTIDSFIYRDKSNTNDPSNSKNDVVLGQIAGDESKTINKRRIDNIKNKTLPSQPVNNVIQVSGSSSGSNFKEKTVDYLGRVSGNFELVKDTGVYGGSSFGFDKLHWINNNVLFTEDRIKGKFNGQDNTSFSDVLEIPSIQQNISIANENSYVFPSDRSLIQLSHTPAVNITRVFNLTTGERYIVSNQNYNNTGTTNTTGVIKITGNTLPTSSDVLQVDYTWVVSFDQYSDYDGRTLTSNVREVSDSIDWGYSNLIKKERVSLTKNTSSTYFTGNTTLPISTVLFANVFKEVDGVVEEVSSGVFAGRKSVVLENLRSELTSLNRVVFKNNNTELYNTPTNDGNIGNIPIVVGIQVDYTATIVLPTDTPAAIGDSVSVIFNSSDIYQITNSTGSFNGTLITIPVANYTTDGYEVIAEVDYICAVQELISTNITNLPFSRSGNGYLLNNSSVINTNPNNVSRKDFLSVLKNGSNQYYVELNLTNLESASDTLSVVSVIRLSDNVELWNSNNIGTITTNVLNNNYQLILNGLNSPAIGDKVLVIYFAENINRFNPFTFKNDVFQKQFDILSYDSVSEKYTVNIHSFVAATGLTFEILEPNTDIVLATNTDGYILTNQATTESATFGTLTDFTNILDGEGHILPIMSKKIKIINSTNPNNNNTYDIVSFDELNNTIVIKNNLSQIDKKQVSIVRLSDGKELWSDSGTIDFTNNKLMFPFTTAVNNADPVLVMYFKYDNLKQSPTRLAITVSDQVITSGVLSVAGTTITKATDVVFSATSTNLKQSIYEAMRKVIGLNSSDSIPTNIKLVNIAKLERVSTANNAANDVLSSNYTYDLLGAKLNDNSFYSDLLISDSSLGYFDFVLPDTEANNYNLEQQFKLGDKFRITFYYSETGNTENLSFTRNGTLYTNKTFALIDKVYVSSGFNSSLSTKIIISSLNQPISGTRYRVSYSYLAPKVNERITVSYNYNKLVADTTFSIENNRPINADVLVREAKSIDIDLTMTVSISTQYQTSKTLVLQNLKDKLISAINSTSLGTTLDSSNFVNIAFSVDGITAARVSYFNKSGVSGQMLSLTASNDEYFVANNIVVS